VTEPVRAPFPWYCDQPVPVGCGLALGLAPLTLGVPVAAGGELAGRPAPPVQPASAISPASVPSVAKQVRTSPVCTSVALAR
jgi:hypothetical protein